MYRSNFHTHSKYSDGQTTMVQLTKAAIDQGMSCLGFSDHGFVPFESKWNMKETDAVNYCREVRRLKKQFKNQITLCLGMEIDFIPAVIGLTNFKKFNLDFTIGSVHYLKQFENGEFWNIDASKKEFKRGVRDIFDNNPRGEKWSVRSFLLRPVHHGSDRESEEDHRAIFEKLI